MENLIIECNNFIKDCGFTYAFCGGFAFELFTKTKNRSHSDIDITCFNEDKKNVISFLLSKGWNVYEHLQYENCLRLITDPNDKNALNCFYIWAIKPDCSFIDIKPKPNKDNIFNFTILNNEQLNFDFIDIIFNERKNEYFICDKDKDITRSIDKAILFYGDIPYLAPEVILFIISNPAYVESDYHREKNNTDWKFTPPFLQKESMEWLIKSLEVKYPEGNIRIEQLKKLKQTL